MTSSIQVCPLLCNLGYNSSNPYLWPQTQRPGNLSCGQWPSPVGVARLSCWLGQEMSAGPCVRFHRFLHKSLTVIPSTATLSGRSQHFTCSYRRRGRGGEEKKHLLPWAYAIDLTLKWCLNGKQTFLCVGKGPLKGLTQNKFAMKSHEPIQCWQCNDAPCK